MINILDLVKEKGLEPKRVAGTHGGEYHSPCPDFSCGGKDRFHVWPEQNNGGGSYWCNGCKRGGDAIQFLIDFDGLSFRQACERLGREAPSSMAWKRVPKPPSEKAAPVFVPDPPSPAPQAVWIEKAGKLVGWAHGQLLEKSEQLAWLQARGLRRGSAEDWKLGWIPTDMWRPRSAWGLPPDYRQDGKEKKLWIPAGLVIPMVDAAGQVIRIRIRRPEGEPRYYVLPGGSSDCWVSRPGCRAYAVTEAELDGILIAQDAGDICGAVALGNSSRKPEARTYEQLRRAAVILNALDHDAAGIKASTWWRDTFPQCKRWPVPAGKDPGDAVREGVKIREWIRAGLPKAWSIGPFSPLDSIIGGGGEEEVSSESPSGAGSGASIPDGVRELARVLAGTPVFIELGEDTLKIRESEPWALAHFQEAQRIRDLIFGDQKVFDYLDTWGIGKVTGENILRGRQL